MCGQAYSYTLTPSEVQFFMTFEAAKNKITDVKGSPNLLLQTNGQCVSPPATVRGSATLRLQLTRMLAVSLPTANIQHPTITNAAVMYVHVQTVVPAVTATMATPAPSTAATPQLASASSPSTSSVSG